MIFLNIYIVHAQRGFSENIKVDLESRSRLDYNNVNLGHLFGSNRSSRSHNLCLSIWAINLHILGFQVCLLFVSDLIKLSFSSLILLCRNGALNTFCLTSNQGLVLSVPFKLWTNQHFINTLIFLVVNCCGVAVQRECGKDQFKCKNENKNQILSINDFNKEREKCIPRYYRCDGRSNLCTEIRKDFFKRFLGMTVRMEVMKMIVISVTSKSTKSLCELKLCLNFK